MNRPSMSRWRAARSSGARPSSLDRSGAVLMRAMRSSSAERRGDDAARRRGGPRARPRGATGLPLQLPLQLVEEAPVGAVGDDFLRTGLDHPRLGSGLVAHKLAPFRLSRMARFVATGFR